MPIYAYRCDSCGHSKDVLQKISDPLLTVCPACSAESFKKQVTAAGFQLKGSGWYVTDFRDQGNKAKAPAKPAEGGEAGSASGAAGADAPAAAAPSPSTGGAAAGTATRSRENHN
jgi:putative FmdB family regulatory protein